MGEQVKLNNNSNEIQDLKKDFDPFEVIDINEENRITQKIKAMKEHKTHDLIHNIPLEMREVNSWLYGNYKNAPSNSEGIGVSYNNVKNLHSFNELVDNNKNRLYYVFRLSNDFIVIDLDDCLNTDGSLKGFAKEVIALVKDMNPYIERSMSGTGLHVILKSSKSWDNTKTLVVKLKNKHEKYNDLSRKSGIDFMNNKHCITLTGDVFEDYKPQKLGTVKRELKSFYANLVELTKKDIGRSKNRLEKKKFNGSIDQSDLFSVINNSVSIEQVCEEYGITTNSYQHIKCPLPDHNDKTPSMWIYEYSNTWYCFGCAKGGDVIHLVALIEDIREIESAKLLNEKFELNIDFESFEKNLDEEWIITDDNGKISIDENALRDHLFVDHNIYVSEQDIYIYEDGHYKAKHTQEIKKIIENHMPGVNNNKFKHSTYVDEVFKKLSRNFQKYEMFNNDKYFINFKNGCMKLKHGSNEVDFIDHSPEFLTTIQVAGNYDENCFCPIWDKFINETLDPDQIILVQEMAGYALINNNNAKKFFGFYGKGDSGKSVLLEAIVRMVGDAHASAIELQKLTDKAHKFASAGLKGRLINVCGDLSSRAIEDTALIKSLTSSTDKIAMEKKGKDAIYLYNTTRMYFSFNNLPSVRDKSKEFFNRFIIVPFNNVKPVEEQDTELIDKFNIDGITTWAVEGLKRLLQNKFRFSETNVNKEIIKHYIELDSPVVEFISNYIEFDESCEMTQNKLLEGFKFYCKNEINNEYSAKMKMNTFLNEISNNFDLKYSKRITHDITGNPSARGFKGIKFTDDFIKTMTALSF